MSKVWTGLYYSEGELRRVEVIRDEDYRVNMWVSGDLRDDIESVDDVDGVFFATEYDFVCWRNNRSAIDPPLSPEEVWDLTT